MIRTRNPILVISVGLIPMLILSWIFYGTFNLLETYLFPVHIRYWKMLGQAIGFVVGSQTLIAFYHLLKRKSLTLGYSTSILIIYCSFIYLFIDIYPHLLPSNLPGLITRNIILFYTLGFISPSLVHSLSILVLFTFHCKNTIIFQPKSLLIALCYTFILFNSINDFREGRLVLFTLGSVIILYPALFGVYIYYRKIKRPYIFNFVLKLVMVVALPVTVLVLDTEILYNIIHPNKNLITFLLFTILNGISLCLPNMNWKNYRLALFTARSMSSLLILFLFLQFGTNLPLSIPTFAGLGLGICCTAPVLFVLGQPMILLQDFRYLSEHFSLRTIMTVFLSSFLSAPLFFL